MTDFFFFLVPIFFHCFCNVKTIENAYCKLSSLLPSFHKGNKEIELRIPETHKQEAELRSLAGPTASALLTTHRSHVCPDPLI